MNIVWSRPARQDLRELVAYIAADNPAAARTVLGRIKAAVEGLREHPQRGRPGRVAATRELVIPPTPYLVPYRIKNNRLEVLRVYHSARRWPDSFQ